MHWLSSAFIITSRSHWGTVFLCLVPLTCSYLRRFQLVSLHLQSTCVVSVSLTVLSGGLMSLNWSAHLLAPPELQWAIARRPPASTPPLAPRQSIVDDSEGRQWRQTVAAHWVEDREPGDAPSRAQIETRDLFREEAEPGAEPASQCVYAFRKETRSQRYRRLD